jgi:hypothetical protein
VVLPDNTHHFGVIPRVNQVPSFIGFFGVLMHVRMTRTAQENEIGESKRNLLITRTTDAFDLPMVNVGGFP